VLDARLQTAPGERCAARCGRCCPPIKALILTSYNDDKALFAANMAGDLSYVFKQIRSSDLLDCAGSCAWPRST
jgi:two-component system response regulator DevR